MDRPAEAPEYLTVHLQYDGEITETFISLLQAGFQRQVRVPTDLPELLTQQLGIERVYVEEVLQTLFVNGRPIDSLDQSIICPGDVIALSAALPGLVGATMRRAGHYSALREGISGCSRTERQIEPQMGLITVKLFNTTARDLSELMLRNGILIDGVNLIAFLKAQDVNYWHHCKAAAVNEQKVSPTKDTLLNYIEKHEPVLFVVV